MARKPRPARPVFAGILGSYVPGDTVLHRASPGAKLLAAAAVSIVLAVVSSPWLALAGLVLAAGIQLLAGISPQRLGRTLIRTAVLLSPLGALVWWQRGWPVAAETIADIMVAILLALAVTATTRADRMLDSIVAGLRPMRHVGLNPERVALAIALMLRTIPALVDTGTQVRDAARARGLERSPRAFATPFALRAIGRAFVIGDAITARGAIDD